MHVHEFSCPQCSTRLRVRDRTWIGRTIACPDCRTDLTVTADPVGKILAQPTVTAPVRKTKPKPTSPILAKGDGLEIRRRPRRWIDRPSTILAALAAAGAGLVALLVMWAPAAPPVRAERSKPTETKLPRNPAPLADRGPAPETTDDVTAAAVEMHEPPVVENPEPRVPLPVVEQQLIENEMPVLPTVAEDVPRLDLKKILDRPIVRFSQKTPLAAEDLLQQVAELVGAPIETSTIPVAQLHQLVTVDLEATTLRGILEEIAKSIRAEPRIDHSRMRLVPRAP